MARELSSPPRSSRGARQISNSTVVALDELGRSRTPRATRSTLLDTLHDPDARRSAAAPRRLGAQGPPRRRDLGPARAREARGRALLLREPDPARDREVLGVTSRGSPSCIRRPCCGSRAACRADNLRAPRCRPARGGRARKEVWHAARIRRQDSQRRPGGPPREREDLAARGAPLRGGGNHPARIRSHDGTTVSDADGRREGARHVDLRVAGLLRVARREDQPHRHAW
jgi:hypothetical protein